MTPLTDPSWRKGLKELGIWVSLFISLIALFTASILPAVLYAELWMLSLPPIALGIIYFGGKILIQRYENILDSMTVEEKLDLQRRSELPPGTLTKMNLIFISVMLAVTVAIWLCGRYLL